jgi:RNA polymerase sigma-70 factor (ECF subfamily)
MGGTFAVVSVKSYVPSQHEREQLLVRQAQAGEPEALATLYRDHSPAVFRYFLFRVRDRATAEDLTAEVFLRMVEGLPRYVDRGLPFAAWLFRIAHDRVVDHHRRSGYRQTEALSEHLQDSGPDTEAQAFRRAENLRLYDLIGELTDEQQLVVQLRFVEGYSLDEVARLLDKTTGATKALQHRALRQLARRIER